MNAETAVAADVTARETPPLFGALGVIELTAPGRAALVNRGLTRLGAGYRDVLSRLGRLRAEQPPLAIQRKLKLPSRD